MQAADEWTGVSADYPHEAALPQLRSARLLAA
jgi:hypothetical protein